MRRGNSLWSYPIEMLLYHTSWLLRCLQPHSIERFCADFRCPHSIERFCADFSLLVLRWCIGLLIILEYVFLSFLFSYCKSREYSSSFSCILFVHFNTFLFPINRGKKRERKKVVWQEIMKSSNKYLKSWGSSHCYLIIFCLNILACITTNCTNEL